MDMSTYEFKCIECEEELISDLDLTDMIHLYCPKGTGRWIKKEKACSDATHEFLRDKAGHKYCYKCGKKLKG